METLAAVEILRGCFPDLRIRVVNVVDLMRLQDDREHPHGLSDAAFDSYFTADKPVIFAYHGYPWLIHRLTYRRTNHDELPRPRLRGGGDDDDAVRHLRDEPASTATTWPSTSSTGCRGCATVGAHARDRLRDQLIEHRQYVRTHGEDLPEIRDWQWTGASGPRVTGGNEPLHEPEA